MIGWRHETPSENGNNKDFGKAQGWVSDSPLDNFYSYTLKGEARQELVSAPGREKGVTVEIQYFEIIYILLLMCAIILIRKRGILEYRVTGGHGGADDERRRKI